jgi:hypothetical protein
LCLDVIRLIEAQEKEAEVRSRFNAVSALRHLADMASAACNALAEQDLSGANLSGKWARATLICDLNTIYLEVDGETPGWHHDRDADEYSGPFFSMVDDILTLTAQACSNGALGKAIHRAVTH